MRIQKECQQKTCMGCGFAVIIKRAAIRDELKAAEATKVILPVKNRKIKECSNLSSTIMFHRCCFHNQPIIAHHHAMLLGFSVKKMYSVQGMGGMLLLYSANDAPIGHVLLIEEQDDEILEKCMNKVKSLLGRISYHLFCNKIKA